MPRYRAFLIDLDDTLYDRAPVFRAWLDDLAAGQLGRTLDDAERAEVEELDRRGHRSRHELAADLAARFGLRFDPVAFPHDLAARLTDEPEARAAIAALARTCRVAIVTNGGGAQRAKLARIGVADLVHATFVSQEVGHAKPAREIFELALRWTECAPGDVVFAGDHPTTDLAPASALGMATAWRVRGAWPADLAPPTHRFHDVAELLDLR
ncbi:MAG: HAD family hydrolase [Deltaproteobacteria bacterium]|nr:HAD family hydrolase [Deltaproteobacteria bacterium]